LLEDSRGFPLNTKDIIRNTLRYWAATV